MTASGPPVSEASRIVLVRHGETEWSLSGQHTSRTDLPLTDDGRKRAAALTDLLSGYSVSLVLSSPLRHALETCQIAGFGEVVELDDDLLLANNEPKRETIMSTQTLYEATRYVGGKVRKVEKRDRIELVARRMSGR